MFEVTINIKTDDPSILAKMFGSLGTTDVVYKTNILTEVTPAAPVEPKAELPPGLDYPDWAIRSIPKGLKLVPDDVKKELTSNLSREEINELTEAMKTPDMAALVADPNGLY